MKIYDFNGKKNLSGDRIRGARVRLQLMQAELAARMQVEDVLLERDSVSRIEIGVRFILGYELPVFAKVLQVSADLAAGGGRAALTAAWKHGILWLK